MFTKKSYIEIFTESIFKCVELEEKLLDTDLPDEVSVSLGIPELYDEALRLGEIKFLGGRYLNAKKLRNLSPREAADYTFVDGRVPCWINLIYEGYDQNYSYLRVLYCRDLASDESQLYTMPEGNKQFRFMLKTKDQLDATIE